MLIACGSFIIMCVFICFQHLDNTYKCLGQLSLVLIVYCQKRDDKSIVDVVEKYIKGWL